MKASLAVVIFFFVSGCHLVASIHSPHVKVINTAVEGFIFCKSCNLYPIPGATAIVQCKEDDEKVTDHRVTTNNSGYFIAQIGIFRLEESLSSCHVIVCSPLSFCNHLGVDSNGTTTNTPEFKNVTEIDGVRVAIYTSGDFYFSLTPGSKCST